MCTVTFIPGKGKIYLTSNRDEKSERSAAIPPQGYDFISGKIYFPKDGDAGGTWLAVHENGNVIVLLNGGFIGHEPAPPYRKSRGLIVLELLEHESPFNFFRSISLDGIEPFTLVLWQDDELFECRWDAEKKHAKHLDKGLPHIWSSATLYDAGTAARRKRWFDEWLKGKPEFSLDDIMRFHQFTGDGDQHHDLRMNRGGKVFTVSITGIEIAEQSVQVAYLDLLHNKSYLQDIGLKKELAGQQ